MLVLQLSVHASQNVTLAWDPSSDATVTGYKIYIGVVSGNYTQVVDVGNVTTATITVPGDSTKYYCAATVYNSVGNESDFSNEAVFFTSTDATLTSLNFSSGQFNFTVSGAPGASYVIQQSTNLVDWLPVQTNTAPFTFVDANTTDKARCFYRAVSL